MFSVGGGVRKGSAHEGEDGHGVGFVSNHFKNHLYDSVPDSEGGESGRHSKNNEDWPRTRLRV